MDNSKKKYLFLTDTHLKFFGRYKLLNSILDHNPYGVFLTGDISEGFSFLSDLEFLGARIGRPLYFVHGNHEIFSSSFDKVHMGIRKLCATYKNLIWMNDAGIVELNEDTCCIGHHGWYDVKIGDPNYIKYKFDWFLIEDFRKLASMEDRINKMREIAQESADYLSCKLEESLDIYKTIYLLTHVPVCQEANRADNIFSEAFWAPYNCNLVLGQALDQIMKKHKNRRLIVLSGHNHSPMTIQMSRNMECRVGKGSYLGISDEDIIFI